LDDFQEPLDFHGHGSCYVCALRETLHHTIPYTCVVWVKVWVKIEHQKSICLKEDG
jgi:hypothetical protein